MIGVIGAAIASVAGQVVGRDSQAARVIGWITVAVIVVVLFILAKSLYDAAVVDEHERDTRAELNEGVIRGEQRASAAQRAQDQEFAQSQADIQEGMNNAADSDPDGAARPVGPVSQSYYDGLRDDKGRKAR